jgi:hypothetical protein
MRATYDEDDQLILSEAVKCGGLSTYRIKLPRGKTRAHFLEFWQSLEKLGCSCEGDDSGSRRLYAIDVEPSASVHALFDVLSALENAGVLEFEEGHSYEKSGELQ